LSSQQNYHLSRLFRELVNNIIRHASASAVEVAVQAQAGHWLFTVSDDGCGFDQQHPGSGMQAMQQHAEALGAELAWRSSLGAGCQCSLRFNAP
jgi:signal transduction histidine kinase